MLIVPNCGEYSSIKSLTECNIGTTQKLSFGVNTTIELKHITNISDNTGTLVSSNIPCWMPLLSNVVVIYLSSIVVLNPIGQFLDCVTIAFSERNCGVVWLRSSVDMTVTLHISHFQASILCALTCRFGKYIYTRFSLNASWGEFLIRITYYCLYHSLLLTFIDSRLYNTNFRRLEYV